VLFAKTVLVQADKDAEVSALMQQMEDVNKDCKEKRSQLDLMASQLQTAQTANSELQRELADSRVRFLVELKEKGNMVLFI
jgi:predicted GTPase